MSLFGKKPVVVQQEPVSPALDARQIEAALNTVVVNMKKTYDTINSRLDKMQSEIEESFKNIGEDFMSLSRDVEALKGLGSEDLEEPVPRLPRQLYKRVTSDEVSNFEVEKEKKKGLLRKK